MSSVEVAGRVLTNPIDGMVMGDPFVLRWRGWFYLYGTNDGPPLSDGREIPVYRSRNLIDWENLGGAVVPADLRFNHWAPEVLAWNGRFHMVLSFGDVETVGHALWVATADRPEGPFHLVKRLSDPSEVFSIDGAWFLDDDGRLYLYRCLDFNEPESTPHGTGVVVQPMSDPFTLVGPPRTVLRGHAPWHLFERDRVMRLYGGRLYPEWTTIEGPAPVRRAGRVFCGYSGGNYTKAYGTGEAVADDPLGPFTDLRGREGPIFATKPGLVDGPGHFAVFKTDLIQDWIILHGRVPGHWGRRIWLCPARWDRDGVTIGELTDKPQPAPPLPSYQSRFEESGVDGIPDGWRVESGTWRTTDEGLTHAGGDARGRIVLDEVEFDGHREWALEVHLRFDGPGAGEAGIVVRGDGGTAAVLVESRPDGGVSLTGADGSTDGAARPTLGDEAFAPEGFHLLQLHAASGVCEVRLDGVAIAPRLAAPGGSCRPALEARGTAVFDAVAAVRRP